jgi:hypothetical protein
MPSGFPMPTRWAYSQGKQLRIDLRRTTRHKFIEKKKMGRDGCVILAGRRQGWRTCTSRWCLGHCNKCSRGSVKRNCGSWLGACRKPRSYTDAFPARVTDNVRAGYVGPVKCNDQPPLTRMLLGVVAEASLHVISREHCLCRWRNSLKMSAAVWKLA